MSSLDDVQRFFARWVLQPEPIAVLARARPEHPAQLIRAEADDVAVARLSTYHRMYFARLHESLGEDFPAVKAALGDAAFEQMCAELLSVSPPRLPSLRAVGEPLPAWLGRRTHARSDVAELAQLEWARVSAFDARDDAPLGLDELVASGDAIGDVAIAAPAGTAIVRVRHDVEAVWSAADRDTPIPAPRARPGAIAVWKRSLVVRHRRLDAIELPALELLRSGTTIALLCQALAPADVPDAAPHVWARLQQWLADGLLVRR